MKKNIGILLFCSLLLVGCSKEHSAQSEDSTTKIRQSESATKETNSTTKVSSAPSNSVTETTDSALITQESSESTITNTPVEQSENATDIDNAESNLNTEDYYYSVIKEARQQQIDYINSIADPQVRQSVQTSQSAAISASNGLWLDHPEDGDIINQALKKVLNEE